MSCDVMGHIWGKKLAQNNSNTQKVMIRLALTLCFLPAYFIHNHAFIFCTFKSWISSSTRWVPPWYFMKSSSRNSPLRWH
ncbi:hypothetical protein DW197_19415 [Enterobacter sp. AM17-18]|nr:hypothetical protein DW197_19415 [Enterobacter sp. AM17-18]